MKVLEHEHPLNLIDLKLKYSPINQDSDEDSDNDDDLKIEEIFRCECDRCHHEINQYHEYYYKCSIDSCGYSVHKFCAELLPTLNHSSHNEHTLFLYLHKDWCCSICGNLVGISYNCYTSCNFCACISCSLVPDEIKIQHPCHPHPLVTTFEPILCKCRACGKRHEGTFYHCTKCPRFSIHNDCAFLPKKLFIQHTTNDEFFHVHALMLSYSFERVVQIVKYNIRCRVCDDNFGRFLLFGDWIYECGKCWFYTHVDCARKTSFISSTGHKNYQDVEHPDLVHLPFEDETNNILKHKFFKEIGSSLSLDQSDSKVTHKSHQHPLTLVDETSSGSKVSCHDPMKRIQLLCNGCLRPITSMPYFKCDRDEQCNKFVLHEWCMRLPDHVENHPGHPQHPLDLHVKLPNKWLGVFICNICDLHCNGFAYSCVSCGYHIDVNCAFIPEKITHTSHPNHLMWRVGSEATGKGCHACYTGFVKNGFSYSCHPCDFKLHAECALLLNGTIRHRFDKHPLKLSYFPIENHKSEYFCEICENTLNPNKWFYHCYECDQSMHRRCAPLILRCEESEDNDYDTHLFHFINIKFGGIYKIEDHPHPLSFGQETNLDGTCTKCLGSDPFLWPRWIFKCLQCEFVIHVCCCKEFKNW